MIKNSAVIYINGINLTAFTVMPLKWGNFLDERLDEMYIGLRHCPFENFKPLTPVEIHFSNELYFGSTTVDTQTNIKRYLIADDQNATENPVGSGLYDHDLYIIEVTKLLECIAVDTNTITNDLGRSYTNNPQILNGDLNIVTVIGSAFAVFNDSFFTPVNTPVNNPTAAGNFIYPSPANVFTLFYNQWKDYTGGATPTSDYYAPLLSMQITKDGNSIYTSSWYWSNGWNITSNFLDGFVGSVDAGNYQILLRCELLYYEWQSSSSGGSFSLAANKYSTLQYNFVVVENQYPLKQWTITDVINRLCDIAEPIRQGETPRFVLQGAENGVPYAAGSQAELFDNVLAPQFSFTKSTFRECLQQCGKVIHGEPRLDIATNADGSFYYQISFDLYGQMEQSNISVMPYIAKTVSQVVDSYASQLDSSAENLVNQLDKYSGVIVEPYREGYKTVRTETLYVRITEENMLIPTQYPIYSIEKVECGFVPNNTSLGQNIDITPYVFESSIYNTQLSSYSSQYPYSKAYGITYTQGQKNLTALNFKPENPISPIFEQYAIINIINAATNSNITSLDDDYPLLAFRVTYTPFYNSRVGQTKLNYGDYPYAATLIYNQQANVIESRYYGENLKGTIARLGNVEKSITYNLARFSEIPAAGQLFDSDYYISAVSVEFLPTYIKCTLGLSKDFNRLSQYIGISSVKRFYEVSQGQTVERNTLWNEYIVVGDQITPDTDCYTGANMMQAIANTFDQDSSFLPLTNVTAWGESYGGSVLPVVSLPVVSSAFGNSIAFSWTYEDNYSAGAVSSYQTNTYTNSAQEEVTVSGYFQDNYKYTDYYGKMYYYNFDLEEAGTAITDASQQTSIGTALPEGTQATTASGYVSTVGQSPITFRKDNREKPQCNFQIDFVSNRDGLIIGSALAAYCSAVRTPDSSLSALLYIFDQPLNKFIDHVSGSINVDISQLDGRPVNITQDSAGQFHVSARYLFAAGKSWAICTQQTIETTTVQDDEGNIVTQSIQKGGDVLIAQNMTFEENADFPTVYFTLKRDIFDRSCWVANK